MHALQIRWDQDDVFCNLPCLMAGGGGGGHHGISLSPCMGVNSGPESHSLRETRMSSPRPQASLEGDPGGSHAGIAQALQPLLRARGVGCGSDLRSNVTERQRERSVENACHHLSLELERAGESLLGTARPGWEASPCRPFQHLPSRLPRPLCLYGTLSCREGALLQRSWGLSFLTLTLGHGALSAPSLHCL